MTIKKIKNRKRIIPLLFILLIISFISIIIFTSLGSVNIPLKEVIKTLFLNQENSTYKLLIMDLRLPRILGSFIIGGILALSGNILQLIIQNPLADPYILGISSGASFGAVIYTALSGILGLHLFFGLETFSFIFSIISAIIVFMLAKEGKKFPVLSLILSGVIVSFLFNAFTTLITVMFWRNLIHVNIWLMGSTASITWEDIFILTVILLIQTIVIIIYNKELNVLSMGDDMAIYSGVNPEKIKMILILTNIFAVSIAVSKSGIIGFVGLIIPHLVRKIKGPYSLISSLISILSGGIFLTISDFISRTIFAPSELPIGIITSIIGAPLFIYVMKKRGKKL
jgi:iron complex transport system permease protein